MCDIMLGVTCFPQDSDFSTRLSTITAVQPGLARVLQQLLGPSTASLYTQACPPELVVGPEPWPRRCQLPQQQPTA
jgi:hypothetical protein